MSNCRVRVHDRSHNRARSARDAREPDAPEAPATPESAPPQPRRPPHAEAPATTGNGSGSTDLLIEVDGKIVPNYDATIHPFEEGDVVNGKVVRIDQDEVLVDIGYKSEGVIPSNELSIRKTVKP